MTPLFLRDLLQRGLALAKSHPRRSAGAVGIALLAGIWLHETSLSVRLMRAEKTHYPAGARACLSLDTVTGINLGNSGSSAVWAPRTDLTAPTAHPFVFYAGPAQNVPDLAVDLARRGLLRRHDITMTIDVVSDEIGPQARSEGGAYYHPDTVHHTFRQAPAVIYTTERNDPRFTYTLRFRGGVLLGSTGFMTRVYDTPLPETGRYTIPLISPYMTSIVSGACLTVRPRSITSIEARTDPLTGDHLYAATIVFAVDSPPSWMDTPVFRRSAGSPPIFGQGSTVERTTLFKDDHGHLAFKTDFSQ